MFGGAVTLSMRDVILYVCHDLQFRLLSSMGGSACDRYDSLPFPSWQFPSYLKLPSIYLAPTCKGNPLPSPVHCEGFKRNARRTSTISGHQWQQIEFENSYGLATLAFCFVRQIHLPLSTQIYGSSGLFFRVTRRGRPRQCIMHIPLPPHDWDGLCPQTR